MILPYTGPLFEFDVFWEPKASTCLDCTGLCLEKGH